MTIVIERRRRFILVLISLLIVAISSVVSMRAEQKQTTQEIARATPATALPADNDSADAINVLGQLAVKGRAPKTGYTRQQFGDGWADLGPCDMRNYILARDMTNVKTRSPTDCTVMSGTLHDPYTGKDIAFIRGPGTSSAVQIDHVVAISDAWQKGAQQLSQAVRDQLGNDPLELLAVDGPANMQKSDGDAATWLPPNKPFRCRYVARQIAVKQKYSLWVTAAEHDAMARILSACPGQKLPIVQQPNKS